MDLGTVTGKIETSQVLVAKSLKKITRTETLVRQSKETIRADRVLLDSIWGALKNQN